MNNTDITVILEKQPVELFKILKFENLVMSGGEAKYVISQGMVMVNGKVETRKRKKITAGDIIEFNGQKMITTSTFGLKL